MADFQYDAPLRTSLISGIEQALRVIAPNFGPTGKTTLIQQQMLEPQFLHSGSTVLRQLSLQDKLEDIGLSLVRSSALRLGSAAGDGVTLAMLLTGAILSKGNSAITAGIDPMQLRRGILASAKAAADTLRDNAQPLTSLETVEAVALIASSDKQTAHIIRDAFEKVSLQGVVTTETSLEPESRILYGGIRYEYGYASPMFANDETGRVAKLENPYVLLVNHDITDIRQLLPILEQTLEQDASLLIIAKEIKEEPLAIILSNVKHGRLKAVVANGPGHGETRRRNMAALSTRIGSALIEENCGIDLSRCGLEVCGQVDSAVIEKYSTLLTGANGGDEDLIRAQQKQTEMLLSETSAEEEIEELKTTLGILAGDSVKILVGGNTQIETDARKHTIDNALFAVYTAVETGTLPGGGKGLLLAVPAVDKIIESADGAERMGAVCVRQALLTPAKTIADNTGFSGSYITACLLEVESKASGFDAAAGEFTDLTKRGILDPAGIVYTALELAAETAASLLTIQAAIY